MSDYDGVTWKSDLLPLALIALIFLIVLLYLA